MTGRKSYLNFEFKDYHDTLNDLYSLSNFGIKLGLDNMYALMSELDNPQDQLEFIHIAGTNGKGSTTAFLSSIMQSAGIKIGAFTSPHLVDLSERFTVNSVNIKPQDFLNLARTIHHAAQKIIKRGARYPTFFEFMTALAILHFVKQKCELVIWETGLGGRLDATNIVNKIAALITNVDFDHTEYLGNSLPEITAEKCGIITPQLKVFTTETKLECLNVIREKVENTNSSLVELKICEQPKDLCCYSGYLTQEATFLQTSDLGEIKLGLNGVHQLNNGFLALRVAEWYLKRKNIQQATQNIKKGLSQAIWLGRMQSFGQNPKIITDCAHNLAGIVQLVDNLKNISSQKWIFILGGLNDKHVDLMAKKIIPLAKELWYTQPNSERAVTTEDFISIAKSLNSKIPIRYFKTAAEAAREIKKGNQYMITGSCYLIGAIIPELARFEQQA